MINDNIKSKVGNIDAGIQYEASMISMVVMMIGLLISIIYAIVYFDFKIWFKIVTAINGFAGLIFMASYLVMTYQQYKSYKQFQGIEQSISQFYGDKIEKEVSNGKT